MEVLMKVSIIKQDNYDYTEIKEKLLESLDNLGGVEKFIEEGDKILLKPNLLMKKKPEEATTTHPTLIKALAEIIFDHGGTVIIGDSPGGPFNNIMLTNIYKSTGMTEASSIKNTELNTNFKSFTKDFKEGIILNNILLTDMINDVDKIINVSKLKTHGFAVFTGAVKNLFGLVPGTNKAEYHVKMPNINDFANSLIDICESTKPNLHIMDGIDAMEGAGPSGGNKKHLGLILASENPHHVDLCASKIIGLEVEDVPTLRKAKERGLIGDFDFIKDILGENIQDLIVSDFKKAPANSGNLRNIPKPIINLLINQLKSKPVFHHNICIGCGDCAANCPPAAIEMINRKPKVDYGKCISCFCCQELCPVTAITIKKPFLAKLIFK